MAQKNPETDFEWMFESAPISLWLEDYSALKMIKANQTVNYALDLFDYSPVSLWVEDFSGVKHLLDEVRAQGIRDFRVFISVHPEFVGRCMKPT